MAVQGASAVPRVASVDILRGLVMIVMALDHSRDYINPIPFDPVDLTHTYPALFLTRWITHFCAPVFVFLAGTSAFLWERTKAKSKKELSWLLFSRGLWLMLVELVIVNPLWTFQLPLPGNTFVQVIWVIGLSMVVLSALIYLPFRWLLGISAAVVLFHNALDPIKASGEGWWPWLWTVLHEDGPILMNGKFTAYVAYPLIPWFGVMGLGYCLGQVFTWDAARRKIFLIRVGLAAIAGFVLLRASNLYGDPGPWSAQDTALKTALSFINTEKYPPSLLYLLMTLGPAMILLAWFEKFRGAASRVVSIYGKVPFFYYIVHLFVVHAVAVLLGVLQGFPAGDFLRGFWMFPQGYGLGLGGAYLVWIAVVTALYWPCAWYAGLKKRSRNAFFTYL
jgi:uncharacterized membrane protein